MREFIAQIACERRDEDRGETFQYTEVESEGIATAVVADIGHGLHNAASSIKGWFEGMSKK